MYSSSAAFKAAVVSDHVVVSKAEVWATDQKLQEIDVSSGSVTANSGAAAPAKTTVICGTIPGAFK